MVPGKGLKLGVWHEEPERLLVAVLLEHLVGVDRLGHLDVTF